MRTKIKTYHQAVDLNLLLRADLFPFSPWVLFTVRVFVFEADTYVKTATKGRVDDGYHMSCMRCCLSKFIPTAIALLIRKSKLWLHRLTTSN